MSDIDEPTAKIPKLKDRKNSKTLFSDITLQVEYNEFKAPPIHFESQKIDDLPAFLVEKGALITKLSYDAEDFSSDEGTTEQYRQLILKHCPNISEVKLVFTEYPDMTEDDESQLLVKFLTALAPGLTSLETVNNVIGLHYLSCMGYVYENFSRKIKFLKTDELKPEELSVLGGDNNNDNCAASLEELIFIDNDLLYSNRVQRSVESLALKPKSLADLVKLKNLKRIDLPFLLNKDNVPQPIDPLPFLTYASIRLQRARKGIKPSLSSFVKNIGIALANITELKLSDFDPGLMVLAHIFKTCDKLEKVDLTELYVPDDCSMGLAELEHIELNFKQLDAKIGSSKSLELLLYLINKVKNLSNINITEIDDEETMNKVIAAGRALAEVVQHEVLLNLKRSRRSSSSKQKEEDVKIKKESPIDNLKVIVSFD